MTATRRNENVGVPRTPAMGLSREGGIGLLEIAPGRARRNPNCYGGGESVVLTDRPPVVRSRSSASLSQCRPG